MTTYRAVVKYPIDATDEEKIRQLRDGLSEVAVELIDLGCSFGSVEDWLESAEQAAWYEVEANRGPREGRDDVPD